VWRRFLNNPNVIGYDFLNEPLPGSDDVDFTRRYLFPFYRLGAANLQQTDPSKIFFFQPALQNSGTQEPLGVGNAVFAPHFYVLPQLYTATQLMNALLSTPARSGVPVIISEYGDPNVSIGSLSSGTPARDREDASLFDAHALGAIRPWYTTNGAWALRQPDGSPNPRIAVFSRPYPQRIAGSTSGWTYDFGRRILTFDYFADTSVRAQTQIYVPRNLGTGGFSVVSNDGLQLDSTSQFYDSNSQILTISSFSPESPLR